MQRGSQQFAHAVIRITVFLSKEHLYRTQLTIETTGYLVSCYTAHSSTTQTNRRKISNSFDMLVSSTNIVNSSTSPHRIMDKCCCINLSGLTFVHTNIRSLKKYRTSRPTQGLCKPVLKPTLRGGRTVQYSQIFRAAISTKWRKFMRNSARNYVEI